MPASWRSGGARKAAPCRARQSRVTRGWAVTGAPDYPGGTFRNTLRLEFHEGPAGKTRLELRQGPFGPQMAGGVHEAWLVSLAELRRLLK